MRYIQLRLQDIIEAAFELSVDGGASNPLLGTRLHDFGFRGCTCVEQVCRRIRWLDCALMTRFPVNRVSLGVRRTC